MHDIVLHFRPSHHDNFALRNGSSSRVLSPWDIVRLLSQSRKMA